MTALFLYGAVLLMAASVIVNRIGQRRMVAARKGLAADEASLRSLDQSLLDNARALVQVKQRNEALGDQIRDTRLAVDHLTEKFEQARAAPMDKFYIFDRLDARLGTIWALDVRRNEEAASDARLTAAWPVPRTYLIVAATPREAADPRSSVSPATKASSSAQPPSAICSRPGEPARAGRAAAFAHRR